MVIIDDIRDHTWKVGDTFLLGSDVYMICYDNTTNRFLLMNIRTGISVFCHNTLEELCSDSITSEALNVDIHTKIKLGGN